MRCPIANHTRFRMGTRWECQNESLARLLEWGRIFKVYPKCASEKRI